MIEVTSPKGPVSLGVPPGDEQPLVTDFFRRHGMPLNARCGGRRAVRRVHGGTGQGLADPQEAGRDRHRQWQRHSAVGAGCEHRIPRDAHGLSLNIPARSILVYEPAVLTNFRINVPFAHAPLWQAAPTSPDHGNGSTAGATSAVASGVTSGGSGGSKGGGRVPLGVAIDVGTTTVAVLLVDLTNGTVLATTSGFNRQMDMGDDVVTRINLCTTDPTMLGKLQEAVVKQTIAGLISAALRHADKVAEDVVVVTVSGNTTMLHILAGVDPTPLGFAPFTAVFLEHRVLKASQIGLKLAIGEAADHRKPLTDDPEVHLLPGAAAYVGSDLVAGILSSGMIYRDEPTLLVDVGTNGEIILKKGNEVWGCATAAGPAFEGARLASGIRAGNGAISRIKFDKDPFAIHTEVIGNSKPIGLCGSAYIDFLSDAHRAGIINMTGRFEPDAVPGLKQHIVLNNGHAPGLRIAHGRQQADIVITESDIASLLQAKAAIAAGMLVLLDEAGLKQSDIKTVYLAGGFGVHLDHGHAIGSGLLPGFKRDQVQVVGNSSLAGAYLALMDSAALEEMRRIGKRVNVVELNLRPQFEETYIDQLTLPEPEAV